MKLPAALSAALLVTLAGCGGGGSQAENTAERLEEAAEQSDPAAAPVLENAADAVREGGAGAGNTAQQALEQAGNAQATTVPTPQTAPPSMQAQPNRTGQQTPPPKTRAEVQPTGNSQ